MWNISEKFSSYGECAFVFSRKVVNISIRKEYIRILFKRCVCLFAAFNVTFPSQFYNNIFCINSRFTNCTNVNLDVCNERKVSNSENVIFMDLLFLVREKIAMFNLLNVFLGGRMTKRLAVK